MWFDFEIRTIFQCVLRARRIVGGHQGFRAEASLFAHGHCLKYKTIFIKTFKQQPKQNMSRTRYSKPI